MYLNFGGVVKTVILALSIMIFSKVVFANNKSNELISTYDLRTYHPEQYSLKDLVFEVRIEDLVQKLRERLSLKDLKDVYFKVYWMFPGKYKIDVVGLPKGLTQIEKELKTLIQPRLDFVIPERLGPKLRSYSLKYSKKGKNVYVKAIDPTQAKDINEMQMIFNEGGQLKQLKTLSPAGVSVAKMKMGPKGWSHNKWVLQGLEIKTILGVQVTKMKHDVSYEKFSGFGFPSEIKTVMEQELLNSSKVKGNERKRKFDSEMMFKNYQINTGEARKQIVKVKE